MNKTKILKKERKKKERKKNGGKMREIRSNGANEIENKTWTEVKLQGNRMKDVRKAEWILSCVRLCSM